MYKSQNLQNYKIKSKKLIITLLIFLFLSGCKNKKIKVVFDTNGGSNIESDYFDRDTNFDEKIKPYKDNNKFLGWYIDKDLSIKYSEDKIKNNIILYAKWEKGIQINPLEVYLKAYNNFLNQKNFYLRSEGEVLASIAKQKLISIKKKKDNNYIQYTASKGMVNTFYEVVGKDDNLILYKGEDLNKDLTPKKVISKEKLSLDSYVDTYGIKPYDLGYIINKDTIKEIKNVEILENRYYFEFVLDNEKATVNYKKNIHATNSKENKNIKFNSILLKISIDLDYNFLEINYIEEYSLDVKVLFWMNQTVNTNIREKFISFDESIFEMNSYCEGLN